MHKSSQIVNVIQKASKVIGYSPKCFELSYLLRHHPSFDQYLVYFNANSTSQYSFLWQSNNGIVSLLFAKAAGLSDTCTTLHWALNHGLLSEQLQLANTIELLSIASSLTHNGNEHIPKMYFTIHKLLLDIARNHIQAIDDYNVQSTMLNTFKDLNHASTRHSVLVNTCMQGKCEEVIKAWESLIFLRFGTVLANGCYSMVSLAQHDKFFKNQAFNFGKYFALILNINQTLLNYVNNFRDESLILNLPIMLYASKYLTEEEKVTLSEINSCSFTAYKIHEKVVNSDVIKQVKELQLSYIQKCKSIISMLSESRSKLALEELMNSYKPLI